MDKSAEAEVTDPISSPASKLGHVLAIELTLINDRILS